jgi:hypothetical protein
LASSIARSGVGGDPRFSQRTARKAATPATISRMKKTVRNPSQISKYGPPYTSAKNQASALSR